MLILTSVLLTTCLAFLICKADTRLTTSNDNRPLVLTDIHPHRQQPMCSKAAWHHACGAIIWTNMNWVWPGWRHVSTVCAKFLCPWLLICRDSRCCPVDREARTKLSKFLEVCLFWLSSFEGCVFTNYSESCIPRNNIAARNKVHTREVLSSTSIGFQQLVSASANISGILQAWKMNKMLSVDSKDQKSGVYCLIFKIYFCT